MNAPTLIAYDGSGSTGDHAFYHDETQRIVAGNPDATILFWDTAGRPISREELAAINRERKGGGGTDPAVIADYVKATGFDGDLVIITDGQVGSVDGVTHRLGPNAKFRSVTAHLIHTGGTVNMSVSCPFTRRSPHQVYLYDADQECRLMTNTTAEDLAIVERLTEIGTETEFEAAAVSLEKTVVAATMGSTGDPTLRDALLAMKSRIMRSEARAKGDSDTVRALNVALDERRVADAIALARTLTQEYYPEAEDPDTPTWSARISRLISMTEGALRSTFDLSGISAAIRGDRARRAAAAAPAAAVDAPLTDGNTTTPFECPITCETESDVVLLIAAGDPILTDVDKDIANNLYDCPLNLLNYPALVTALKERLDHPISLRALKHSHDIGYPIDTSPMTRRSVATGAICLGAAESHSRATEWTLAHLFTGGKRVGNPDLWFAVLWILVEQGSVPYLAPILPQLRAHMAWRLTNHQSSVSLTGVPEFPTTRVPLRTAIWYVFASAEFGMEPRRDVLRAHLPHLAALEQLLTLTGLSVSDAVRAHVIRLRTMLSMLSWIKRDRHTLPNIALALTQSCVEVTPAALRPTFERTPRFIPIDGVPKPAQLKLVRSLMPSVSRSLADDELIGLAALVDPSKSAGDIALPIDWTPPPVPAIQCSGWISYGLRQIPRSPVRICAATCRPYYYVPGSNGSVWRDAAERHYGVPVARLISVNEAYGNFVVKYGIYPTHDELLTYLYNRRVVHGGYPTLPHLIAQFVDEVIEEQRQFVDTLPVAEFARRWTASLDVPTRIRMETVAADA
jgi:hypothetical protein